MSKDFDNFKKKTKIPYYFLGIFVFVVVVNILYIFISKQSWRGVATDNSYEKGLNYNETIRLSKEQQKLGWRVETKIHYLSSQRIKLVVAVVDKNGVFISDAKVSVEFKRPTQEGFDFLVMLNPTGKVYLSEVIFPLKGQWDFETFVSKGEETLRHKKRYVIN